VTRVATDRSLNAFPTKRSTKNTALSLRILDRFSGVANIAVVSTAKQVRFILKRRATWFWLALFVLASAANLWAQTSPQKVVLYRWVDAQGLAHYNEKLEDIPATFRAAAVKGTFAPESGAIAPEKTTGRMEEVDETYTREGNFYHIKGQVRNGFGQEVSQVKVKISFYDDEDRFLFAETTLVDPIVLAPGHIGRYHLMVNYNPKIDTYKTEFVGRP
jgi:hypothetical protein